MPKNQANATSLCQKMWAVACKTTRAGVKPKTCRATSYRNIRSPIPRPKARKTAPISQDLYNAPPPPKNRGNLFAPCRKAFERAVKRAGIELPEGQYTHVLRHTFANHFMMNGGNILVLKEILGHSDIKMTMIYAHFAPTHLEDAVSKNPLTLLD